MRIVVAGAHGKVGRLLSRRLVELGHTPVGVVRNPGHVDDLRADGAEPVVLDLEAAGLDEVVAVLAGAGAAVFAAGAGPGSGAPRKLTVDRDAAVLLARASVTAAVRRFVLLSAYRTDRFDPDSQEQYQVYLRAKSEADAAVRELDLDWTVVRPDGLADTPGTGLVTAAEEVDRHGIPRADVAAVLAELAVGDVAVRRQFELTGGDTPIPDALAGL
jgi:uncharacterized protein YbjT (DUF2867 family)